MLFSCSGTRPTNIGVTDGKLATCPNSPNCVSSQANPDDKEHYIEPISGNFETLVKVLHGLERVEIVTQSVNYLHAEFTSKLMGFVDDVEFFQATQGDMIHVRSAARLGYSDFGVNRKRIETIRRLMGDL